MREGTLEMRERGVQMRHFRAIAQDLAALSVCATAASAVGNRDAARQT